MTHLAVEGVSVSFGGVQALNDVSVAVESGSIAGLIGPNGAGKTTCFNVVSGLQPPDGGRVLLGERDITGTSPYQRARLGLGRTFQRLEVFGSLSARVNIQVAAEIYQAWNKQAPDPRQAAEAIVEQVGLSDVADERADELPTGLARLVELGRALAARPEVLLLDEPSSGLDEDETDALSNLLRELAADGLAVLLVEHDVEMVMKVCSLVHVLDFGRILEVGTPEQVQKSAAVQAAYLGTS